MWKTTTPYKGSPKSQETMIENKSFGFLNLFWIILLYFIASWPNLISRQSLAQLSFHMSVSVNLSIQRENVCRLGDHYEITSLPAKCPLFIIVKEDKFQHAPEMQSIKIKN